MNKITSLLPNNLLKKYVVSNFSKLSVEDFFTVIKKINIPAGCIRTNENIKKSSQVLNYILDNNPSLIVEFSFEAFTDDVINKMVSSDIKIKDYIINFPFLLDNSLICEKMIKDSINNIQMLNESQITDNIIKILEQRGYILTNTDFQKYPILLNSEIIVENSLKKHPEYILSINNPTDNALRIAIMNGFLPSNGNLNLYQFFDNYEDLLMLCFNNDPAYIKFFKGGLLDIYAAKAFDRGYIPSEQDFQNNNSLGDSSDFMKCAISINPNFIKFSGNCSFLINGNIYKIINENPITEETLRQYPNLTRNFTIMNFLPQYHLFSMYLTDDEKKLELYKYLKTNDTLIKEKLPFLDEHFNAIIPFEKINELFNILNKPINEKDEKFQTRYLENVKLLIENIENGKYNNCQKNHDFIYSSVVDLELKMNSVFEMVKKTNTSDFIDSFVKDINDFVKDTMSIEEIKFKLENLYTIYVQSGKVNIEDTNEFFNKILNQHRNNYLSEKINEDLIRFVGKLNLTDKKAKTIINSQKLKIVGSYLKNGNYQKLGISLEQFTGECQKIKNEIINNKDILKMGISINEEDFDKLIHVFNIYSEIDSFDVEYILHIEEPEALKFIIKKFDSIKYKYVNMIKDEDINEIAQKEIENNKGKLDLSSFNYKIADNDTRLNNLVKILLNLNVENIDKILNNKEKLSDLVVLIPLLDLIPNLNVDNFIKILMSYDQIKNRIQTIDDNNNLDVTEFLINNIDDILNLANAYADTDDIKKYALGETVAECFCYQIPTRINMLLQMMRKNKCEIPPVFVNYKDKIYESGKYDDPNRLLVSVKPEAGCFDDSAGCMTRDELLMEKTGDIVLVKDKNDEVLSRIILIRRGNVVQMCTYYSAEFPPEVYKSVADQIINQAVACNDNIDYVFVSSIQNESGFKMYDDNRFSSEFPHANFNDYAYLISSKNMIKGQTDKTLNLDFHAKALSSYDKVRKSISYNPKEEDINRIRSLRILLETDDNLREEMSRNFTTFYSKEYDKVICGDDWYIAIKRDGTYEEIILPLNNSITYEEINDIKQELGLSNEYSNVL